MNEIILILHNIRSTYNVGSILRTADGFGVKKIICSGYTPYPKLDNENRLPHIYEKITKKISKSALGAEKYINIEHYDNPNFNELKKNGYKIIGLEQNTKSHNIRKFKYSGKIAILLGEEINGISEENLNQCDSLIEIPMKGKKESFNVSVAVAIALYALTT